MARADALSLVVSRNFFYRDSFRTVIVLFLCSMSVNLCLGVAIFYLGIKTPEPKIIVTTADNRLIPVQPLSAPVKSSPQVLSWASTAVVKLNSYDFLNYRSQLQEASIYFTAQGWKSYLAAIAISQDLEQIIQNKYVVTCVPTGAPVITEKGLVNGKFSWKITIPILVKEQSGNRTKERALLINMMIQREPLDNNPQGMGIVYYQARQS